MIENKIYKDKEYCYSEIRNARKVFGQSGITLEKWECMERGLAFMYAYCPEDLRVIVLSTLEEAGIRKQLMLAHGVIKRESKVEKCHSHIKHMM